MKQFTLLPGHSQITISLLYQNLHKLKKSLFHAVFILIKYKMFYFFKSFSTFACFSVLMFALNNRLMAGAIGNPERHVRKASRCGSKQQ